MICSGIEMEVQLSFTRHSVVVVVREMATATASEAVKLKERGCYRFFCCRAVRECPTEAQQRSISTSLLSQWRRQRHAFFITAARRVE